jgi:hypothetical protein
MAICILTYKPYSPVFASSLLYPAGVSCYSATHVRYRFQVALA